MFFRVPLLFLLLFSFSIANFISKEKPYYIDILHNQVSQKVLEWSEDVDTTVSTWLSEDNSSCEIDDITTQQSTSIDTFFQNNKYLGETDDIYIRMRIDSDIHTKENNKVGLKFRAQIPFSKCAKKFKIFVDGLSEKEDKNIRSQKNNSGDIGVRYIGKDRLGIKSKYSFGLSHLYPFIRARYMLPVKVNTWDIETIQSFNYSFNDKFEEETDIYFDKYLSDTSLFRVNFYRKTNTELYGMDYALSFEYLKNKTDNTGFSIAQTFEGNTKYSRREHYKGINNYITIFTWRENLWRKWFFYEVHPSVNFDRDHDYKANYSVRFFLDFYFGKL
jgi:hypothetical protein